MADELNGQQQRSPHTKLWLHADELRCLQKRLRVWLAMGHILQQGRFVVLVTACCYGLAASRKQ